jgi:outer membrane protein, multidrug efflux system
MIASSLLVALALTQTAAPPPPAGPPAGATPEPSAAGAPPVLTLRQALAEARTRNLDVQQAEARLQQAMQISWKAWSGYLPQVSAGATYLHNPIDVLLPVSPTEVVTIQRQNQLAAQAQVNQAIIAPALWPAIANAYTAERVATLTTDNARREVFFGVAQVYYGSAALKQAVSVTERQLALTRERERDARVRFQAGTTPKVALLRAEIDRAQAEQDLKRAQNSFETSKISLATLLDHSGEFDVEIPPSPRAPEGGLPDLEAAALRDRPDVLAAEASFELAQGQKSAIYYQYAPSLGGFARYQWANLGGITGQQASWILGLSLTWNLFDGGLREANLREASARVVEADAALRGSDARALEEVRTSRLDLESALANKAKATERVTLARENQQITALSYKAGAATYLETTDAVESLRQAELGLVTEALNADLAAVRLLKAVGAFKETY